MDMDRALQLAEQDAQSGANVLHQCNNAAFIIKLEDVERALECIRQAEFQLESVLHEVNRKRAERQGM